MGFQRLSTKFAAKTHTKAVFEISGSYFILLTLKKAAYFFKDFKTAQIKQFIKIRHVHQ